MKKTVFKIYVNDGCPWGNDKGYKTLKDAKKDLKDIIQDDKEYGCMGMTYFIVRETETDDAIYCDTVCTIEI